MFSADFQKVALIRRTKPSWQAGKLNGVGGKVEITEMCDAAMVREFKEETGYETEINDWLHYLRISDGIGGFDVFFYTTTGDLSKLKTTTEEKIEIVDVKDVNPLNDNLLDNLVWCIGAAIDCLKDGRPKFLTARYPA